MPKTVTLDQARAAKAAALTRFGHLPILAGVGITAVPAGYGVKLNLSEQPPQDLHLPSEVDGVPMVVEVVGRVTKRLR